MNQLRNFIIRLATVYIVFAVIAALPGIRYGDELFAVWIIAVVFVLLSAVLRPVLLALTLPLIIVSAGLFLFVIDGLLLLLTGLVTSLEVAGFGWALLATVVMSITNIWVENAFKRLGWLDPEDDDDPQRIESPGLVLRILLSLGLLVAILFSGAMAGQVALAVASTTGNLRVVFGAGLASFALIMLGTAWLIAEGLTMQRRALFSTVVTLLTSVILVVGMLYIMSQPVNVDASAEEGEREARTQFWQLPTGSRIGYTEYLAPGEPRPVPIIFLHDGPGWPVTEEERDFYSRLTRLGYNVYLYDQVGVGQSARLDNPGEYTIQRNVEDLDAIRSQLDADQIILIGQGAGGELAARYMAQFPARVLRAVLISPSPMWDDNEFFEEFFRTGDNIGPLFGLPPRPLASLVVAPYGPRAAANITPQQEMNTWAEQNFREQIFTCPENNELAPDYTGTGLNFYATIVGQESSTRPPDPRPGLGDNVNPTLLITSECSYVAWEVILQYEEVLLNETVFYIEDAGHFIHLAEADLLFEILRAFLLEEEYPIPPYDQTTDPRAVISLPAQ